MEYDKLKSFFYDPSKGYKSKNKLVQLATKEKIKLSKADIEKWYDEQPVNQIYKPKKQKGKYKAIWCPYNAAGCMQVDLQILTKFNSRNNKGFNYLLNILDIYSRYVYSYPIKKKSPTEILPHIKEFYNEFRKLYPHNAMSMTCDDGKEFKGSVKQFLEEKNIKIFIANPKDNTKMRTMLVERYHRTFWDLLKKVLTSKDTDRWIDYHDSIITNYNNTLHSHIGNTPFNVFIKKQNRNLKLLPKKEGIQQDFKEGDNVRYLKNKNQFTKQSFAPKWSIKTYQIHSINGNRMSIKEGDKVKRGTFLSRELQKVQAQELKSNMVKELKEHKKTQVIKRKNVKTGLDVNKETGKLEINKRLKPANEKRIRKAPTRLIY